MGTAEEDFVAAICADDSDDSLLVYADWLLGRGDKFGEEIQLQLELRRIGVTSADDLYESELDDATLLRVIALRHRAYEIWKWRHLTRAQNNLLYRFDTLTRGESFGELPANGAVRVLDAQALRDRDLVTLATAPESRAHLARIRELTIAPGTLVPGTLASLLERTPMLERLHISSTRGLPLGELARAALPNLVELDLRSTFLEAISPLAQATWGPHVRALNLSHNPIGDAGVRSVFRSGAFAKLERINLANTACSGEELAGAGPDLVAIDLTFAEITDAQMGRLVASPRYHQLNELRVSSNELGQRGVEALMTLPAPLTRLELTTAACSPAAFRKLVAAFPLRRFDFQPWAGRRVLDLAAAMDVFETEPRVASLRSLGLHQCKLDDAAALVLARSPFLRGLRELLVNMNEIGNDGALALLHADFPCLMKLVLGANRLASAARDAWREHTHPRLGDLQLGD